MRYLAFAGLIFSFAAVLGVQALTKCQQEEADGKKMVEERTMADVTWLECNPDGSYKTFQCDYGGAGKPGCYCVNQDGSIMIDADGGWERKSPDEC